MPPDLGRRSLLGGAAVAPLLSYASAQVPPVPPPAAGAAPNQIAWQFFTPPEATLVTAAVDRLIPPDEAFTGAVGAGVPIYIDRQLATDYGAGRRLYLHPPFLGGTSEQGYQLPYTPAALYRIGLAAFAAFVQATFGARFEALPPVTQDLALSQMERGDADFGELPAPVFFETLLANTVEGFFSDPIHGGNIDMVGWRMVGFPGAYAGYTELVGRHNLPFTRPPRSIAQALSEHAHNPAPHAHR
ncbi:MAG TPA: gluconate 2-dehydrogenase subunit 3 family protein [Falsiroseomonas sp.]|jgi:gluconate 2-dehydrogenase gamma chain|nr:gluconate 2-dehydrogenase subunit 3 family protein [Falsiroseomonas sp.]